MRERFTGSLYQLESRTKTDRGDYVAVNGPHDSYGVIVKSERTPSGSYLNLVRGVKPRDGEKAVAQF